MDSFPRSTPGVGCEGSACERAFKAASRCARHPGRCSTRNVVAPRVSPPARSWPREGRSDASFPSVPSVPLSATRCRTLEPLKLDELLNLHDLECLKSNVSENFVFLSRTSSAPLLTGRKAQKQTRVSSDIYARVRTTVGNTRDPQPPRRIAPSRFDCPRVTAPEPETASSAFAPSSQPPVRRLLDFRSESQKARRCPRDR